jgi:hypothetical protein
VDPVTVTMQYDLNRAFPVPREVHRHSQASAGRPFAWAGLMMIVMLVAEVFAAGGLRRVSPHFGPFSVRRAAVFMYGHQQHASELNRICWQIDAGVDAQCIDAP